MNMVRAIGIQLNHEDEKVELNEIEVTEDFIKSHSVSGENPVSVVGMVDENHAAYSDENDHPHGRKVKFNWSDKLIGGRNIVIVGIDPKGQSQKTFPATLTLKRVDETLMGYPVTGEK